MLHIDYRKHLEDAITSLQPLDDPGQLAYLALSSKCEHAVRDRIALLLRKHLQGHGRVAREMTLSDERLARRAEWASSVHPGETLKTGAIDLAVLDWQGESVLSTLELKQVYAFDFMNERNTLDNREVKKLRRDVMTQRRLKRILSLQSSSCPVLMLVFDALPVSSGVKFPQSPRVLKYLDRHVKRSEVVGRKWVEVADEFLSGRSNLGFWNEDTGPGTSARIATDLYCGSAEGFSVTLDAWLLQPR